MTDDELHAERLRYMAALEVCEASSEPEFRQRIQRYTRGLGLINAIVKHRLSRSWIQSTPARRLFEAVTDLLDDDSDDNWERVEHVHAQMQTQRQEEAAAHDGFRQRDVSHP